MHFRSYFAVYFAFSEERTDYLFYDHLKGILALSAENNLRRGSFLILKNN